MMDAVKGTTYRRREKVSHRVISSHRPAAMNRLMPRIVGHHDRKVKAKFRAKAHRAAAGRMD